MLTIIAAISENYALGNNNKLLWHLPNDFKRFKQITSGNIIIMGRKTFESLPGVLPNRTHIVITRNKEYKVSKNVIVVNSLKEALKLCPISKESFIIGGGEIYKQSLKFANKLEITLVHHNFEADAFFPEINLKDWQLVNKEHHYKDERHNYNYSFLTYLRK